MAGDILEGLLRLTLAASAAIAVVLLVRRIVRRWVGARIAYALWAAVPCAGLGALLPRPQALSVPAWAGVADLPFAAAVPAASSTAGWLVAAWLAGVLATALVTWRTQARFLRHLGPLVETTDGLWQARGDHAGPALVGALQPRIVIPGDFHHRYSERERTLILAHERAHRRQRDPLLNAAVAALRCLQWFNPLVHLAAGRFRLDQELACDARVLHDFPEARRSYADAMLKTQRVDLGLPIGCQWQSSHPLNERIAMLKKPLPGRLRRILGATGLAAAVLTAGGLAWAAQPASTGPGYGRLSPPAYPADLDGVVPEGTVYLKVRVGSDGTPLAVERDRVVPDSLPTAVADQLADSAAAAVRSWTFTPAQRNGRSEEGSVVVPIRFSSGVTATPGTPTTPATPATPAVPATPAIAAPALDTITVQRR